MDKALQKRFPSEIRSTMSRFTKLFARQVENEKELERKLLLEDIEQALSDIRHARSCFEDAKSPEMIEACIYEIKSAEARYNFLLRKAKLSAARESNTAAPTAG